MKTENSPVYESEQSTDPYQKIRGELFAQFKLLETVSVRHRKTKYERGEDLRNRLSTNEKWKGVNKGLISDLCEVLKLNPDHATVISDESKNQDSPKEECLRFRKRNYGLFTRHISAGPFDEGAHYFQDVNLYPNRDNSIKVEFVENGESYAVPAFSDQKLATQTEKILNRLLGADGIQLKSEQWRQSRTDWWSRVATSTTINDREGIALAYNAFKLSAVLIQAIKSGVDEQGEELRSSLLDKWHRPADNRYLEDALAVDEIIQTTGLDAIKQFITDHHQEIDIYNLSYSVSIVGGQLILVIYYWRRNADHEKQERESEQLSTVTMPKNISSLELKNINIINTRDEYYNNEKKGEIGITLSDEDAIKFDCIVVPKADSHYIDAKMYPWIIETFGEKRQSKASEHRILRPTLKSSLKVLGIDEDEFSTLSTEEKERKLRNHYIDLVRSLHPDTVPDKDSDEYQTSHRLTTEVNTARDFIMDSIRGRN
ncbi:MAG: hypothetical protein CEN89_742 [Candidatus Berkelbacteria bacterium Licking1014_7]|uniref:J domain-containing protein n=1 Tax=Candidatus Berkelbacteria bacterium Licking1014_7 TaxID=2017147 RepID=A0A554LHL0_9BACT|nr:MAG: hypothetical protein CEN89_742 [Candidatus Berkelbacteria bacterium Licking1014_7]